METVIDFNNFSKLDFPNQDLKEFVHSSLRGITLITISKYLGSYRNTLNNYSDPFVKIKFQTERNELPKESLDDIYDHLTKCLRIAEEGYKYKISIYRDTDKSVNVCKSKHVDISSIKPKCKVCESKEIDILKFRSIPYEVIEFIQFNIPKNIKYIIIRKHHQRDLFSDVISRITFENLNQFLSEIDSLINVLQDGKYRLDLHYEKESKPFIKSKHFDIGKTEAENEIETENVLVNSTIPFTSCEDLPLLSGTAFKVRIESILKSYNNYIVQTIKL